MLLAAKKHLKVLFFLFLILRLFRNNQLIAHLLSFYNFSFTLSRHLIFIIAADIKLFILKGLLWQTTIKIREKKIKVPATVV